MILNWRRCPIVHCGLIKRLGEKMQIDCHLVLYIKYTFITQVSFEIVAIIYVVSKIFSTFKLNGGVSQQLQERQKNSSHDRTFPKKVLKLLFVSLPRSILHIILTFSAAKVVSIVYLVSHLISTDTFVRHLSPGFQLPHFCTSLVLGNCTVIRQNNFPSFSTTSSIFSVSLKSFSMNKTIRDGGITADF